MGDEDPALLLVRCYKNLFRLDFEEKDYQPAYYIAMAYLDLEWEITYLERLLGK
jgi:hypothetical protein